MFDKFLLKRSYKNDIYEKNFQPKDSILSRKLLNPKGDCLVVVFPPKGNGEWVYETLLARLVAKNYAVLALYFDNNIMMPDETVIKDSFTHIKDQIVKELDNLYRKNRYKDIKLLGMSLGTVNLCMVAKEFKNFSSAFLICPGGRLSYSIWNGFRTVYIKNTLEQKNITLDKLAIFWKNLEPINNIQGFKGKKVVVLYSSKDKIVPTNDQKVFINNILQVNKNVITKKRFTGHYFTIIRFCLFSKLDYL